MGNPDKDENGENIFLITSFFILTKFTRLVPQNTNFYLHGNITGIQNIISLSGYLLSQVHLQTAMEEKLEYQSV